jgi:hypothetical protein
LKLLLFTKGGDSTTFTYAPNRSRYQKVQQKSSDNTTITTQPYGKDTAPIPQHQPHSPKTFIYLDKQIIAIHIRNKAQYNAKKVSSRIGIF